MLAINACRPVLAAEQGLRTARNYNPRHKQIDNPANRHPTPERNHKLRAAQPLDLNWVPEPVQQNVQSMRNKKQKVFHTFRADLRGVCGADRRKMYAIAE